MTITQIFSQITLMFLSLGAATTMLLHDTHIDKATVTALSAHLPTLNDSVVKIGTDPHTHSERSSLYQAIRDLNASQPRTQPRGQEDRHHADDKFDGRGHFAFDNAALPYLV